MCIGHTEVSVIHCQRNAIHWLQKVQVGWCPPLLCGGVQYINTAKKDLVVFHLPSCHYHASMVYVVTPGHTLLVGIAGTPCSHACPVHVLTMFVMAWDAASHPPMSTRWLPMATASLEYCGAGGSLVHVALSMLYICTTRAEARSEHTPPQMYVFLAMTTLHQQWLLLLVDLAASPSAGWVGLPVVDWFERTGEQRTHHQQTHAKQTFKICISNYQKLLCIHLYFCQRNHICEPPSQCNFQILKHEYTQSHRDL